MPIITTPGQQIPTVPKQDPIITLPSRLQSAFTPTPVKPIVQTPQVQPLVTPQTAPVEDNLDELILENDLDDDSDSVTSMPSPLASTSKPGTSLSRMSEDERRKVILAIFTLVLGKNPADRDYSYYRFSTLTEESLTKSLLNLPEHKKLMEKAHEHVALKQSVSGLDLQVKQLTASMDSMKQELITMQQLLVEKNRYIQQMRGLPESELPQVPTPVTAQTPSAQGYIPPQVQPQRAIEAQSVEFKKLPGPFDELKNMIKGVFSKK